MIPEAICVHFTACGMGCELAYFAPRDCGGCGSYHDGTNFLRSNETDRLRLEQWLDFPRGPGVMPIQPSGA